MPISDEMRRLEAKWKAGTSWPQRLDWIEIDGVRGWKGERFELRFPIMAVVGKNGVGKSTVLQAVASIHRLPGKKKGTRILNPAYFFPDTPWESIEDATIRYSGRQGNEPVADNVKKLTERWRGYQRRPERPIQYIDLGRIQPVPERTGYSKLARPTVKEVSSDSFDIPKVERLSEIMGREYQTAKMSLTDNDTKRTVPVLADEVSEYSGFHSGAGETAVAELLEKGFRDGSIILIDEIETSLHPSAQRRLMRDLATVCRQRELQILLTTHSPYILDELPLDARAYIMLTPSGRKIAYGVSPEFAMSRMDDVPHYECDLYVEDERAKALLEEILIAARPSLVKRCQIVPYGAASVGRALGQMVASGRFPKPSCVYLDGDQGEATGCINLPGQDSPERMVFYALNEREWQGIAQRVGRSHSDVVDQCSGAMLLSDHHEWVRQAANNLTLGGDTLWQAMCAEWAVNCLEPSEGDRITQPISDALAGIGHETPRPEREVPTTPSPSPLHRVEEDQRSAPSPSEQKPPSELSLFGEQE